MKICKYIDCQKPFEPPKGRPNQVYCSNACRLAARRGPPPPDWLVERLSQLAAEREQKRAEREELKTKGGDAPTHSPSYPP